MEIADFVKSFAEQFDETDESVFSPKTNYKDLDEWSSLIVLGIIAMVKTEYGKTVTGAEIRNCETIEALYNLVINR